MYNPPQLGVVTDASRAVNEIPTPTGVARQPIKLRCFSTGVSLTAFLFSIYAKPLQESIGKDFIPRVEEASSRHTSWYR